MGGKWYERRSTFVAGVTILAVIVFAYVLEQIVLQAILETQSGPSHGPDFNKPFFLTYLFDTAYLVYAPIWLVCWWRGVWCRRDIEWKNEIKFAAASGIAYFLNGYLWMLSLSRMSVTANTALSNSEFAFVYVLSVVFLKEKVSMWKISSVVVCAVGVGLLTITHGTFENLTAQTVGYILILVGTLFFAIYEVSFKVFERHDDQIGDVFLRLGLLALFVSLCLWPGLVVLHMTGLEVFELPDYATGQTILKTMLLDGFALAATLCGIFVTTPSFIATGTLLAIPLAAVLDALFLDVVVSPQAYVGAACIVVGFGIGELPDWLKAFKGESGVYKPLAEESGESGPDPSSSRDDYPVMGAFKSINGGQAMVSQPV